MNGGHDDDDTNPVVLLRDRAAGERTAELAPAGAAVDRAALAREETPSFGGVTPPDLASAPTPTAPVPVHVPASVPRTTPFGPPIAVAGPDGAPTHPSRRPLGREPSRPRPSGARPVRDYPVLKGLVHNADAVGGEDRATSTAVPRAFVRAGPAHEPRSSARADVDDMLHEMAEGLLVGGDGAGTSEIRVTLGEEFFGGTELRIQRNADGVTAILRPPDRETYRVLAAELPRLRVHLEERGLRVSNLRVEEP